MIDKKFLVSTYQKEKLSAQQIANKLNCSENKVNYWLHKYGIPKRTISEAVYTKNNPAGNPFELTLPNSSQQWFLYGLGLGLYWGEGNKANKNAVRLGNTDPDLIRMFIEFLEEIYNIDRNKLKFGLQIFSDTNPADALVFWKRHLQVKEDSFYKVTVTPSSKSGRYRKKNVNGVLTVYFSNTKLRDSIVTAIEELRHN